MAYYPIIIVVDLRSIGLDSSRKKLEDCGICCQTSHHAGAVVVDLAKRRFCRPYAVVYSGSHFLPGGGYLPDAPRQ